MPSPMTARERVLAACAFRPPDRIPRFNGFGEYPDTWRARLGPPEGLTDIAIWAADEITFPSRVQTLKEEGGWIADLAAMMVPRTGMEGRNERARTIATSFYPGRDGPAGDIQPHGVSPQRPQL